MDTQAVHDQTVDPHLALLQGIAGFVSRLEEIQKKAKDFLINSGLELIWAEYLATFQFEVLDEISNISVGTSKRLFRLRERVIDCLSKSQSPSSDDQQIVTQGLTDTTRAQQLFSGRRQGAESFRDQFQTFSQRNFLSVLEEQKRTVENEIRDGKNGIRNRSSQLSIALEAADFQDDEDTFLESALSDVGIQSLTGSYISLVVKVKELIAFLPKIVSAITQWNQNGNAFIESLCALLADLRVSNIVNLFNQLAGQWNQFHSKLNEIQQGLNNLRSLSAVQSRVLLLAIETLATLMDVNAKAIIHARAIGPMRR